MLFLSRVRICCTLALLWAAACAPSGTPVPQPTTAAPDATRVVVFCSIALQAPEAWQATLYADDVRGVDCVPPDRGDVFSLGFSHAGWWLQLDVPRRALTVGTPHAFDGDAALLALDCWDWDGSVTVDADDDARWAVRLDARCRADAGKALVGSFSGARESLPASTN